MRVFALPPPIRRLQYLFARLLVAAALIVLLAMQGRALLLFFQHAQLALDFPYTLNYGEGPLLEQAVRLARGENIYRADLTTPPYTIANYPPLYPLVQAPFVAAVGPAFWYGRLISVFSILAAALFLGLTVRAITRDALAALVAALTLPAIPYVFSWSALARIDSLALACAWAGIFAVVQGRGQRWGVIAGVILLACAAYTRQTYLLAAPMAAVAWLWGEKERTKALMLGVYFAALVLGVFAGLTALTGGGVFFHLITANVNALDPQLPEFYWNEMLAHLPIFLAAAALALVLGVVFGRRLWWLSAPYTLGAVVTALTISKVGSDVNYLYELAAAFALAAGAWIAWTRRFPVLRALLLLILAYAVSRAYDLSLSKYQPILTERVDDAPLMTELIAFIDQTDAPIIADEHMALLTLAARPILIQPFEMSQLAAAGTWDETPFLEDLQNGVYPYILIYQPYRNPSLRFERWTRPMLREINDHYRPLLQTAETTVYQYFRADH
ncbi:MAG: glycosyltransferase family 39 protein [Chloroflexi bacterium]|uniref:glycosyltransferase family 39 protein n=1 Tax=Candidatus Flexifilum breve TaxID=3140694 RepID=UPI003137079D|nr:glycosyltransferase family 39 protein [Chloroflexota bacterium]